jgi:hypothetical protein
MVEHQGAIGEFPHAVAPLIFVEIAAQCDEQLRVRPVGAVPRLDIMFALGPVAIHHEQAVADRVAGQRPVRGHLWQPGDEIVGRPLEHRAMVVDRIVMIERSHQREIAPVAPPAIAHDEVVERDPVEPFLHILSFPVPLLRERR